VEIVKCAVAVVDSLPDLPARLALGLGILNGLIRFRFTLEYFARIYAVPADGLCFKLLGYRRSCAIFPSYLGLAFFGYQYLLVIRVLRLLRVFRILRMVRFHSRRRDCSKHAATSIK
jgi:voltage-gated potassium channel